MRPAPHLLLLAALPSAERRRTEAAVGDLDWQVSNLPDGPQLAESYIRRAPDAAWAVLLDREPVGLFCLLPYA